MKILMYSHDTFGLGHLRRARTIANSIAGTFDEASITIVSGSPLGQVYSYSDAVHVVQIPPVRKQGDGLYAAANGNATIEAVISARQAAIDAVCDEVNPDLMIVDKEPLGLQREMLPALVEHKRRGARTVLGLREVLDTPERLRSEWQRKGVFGHLEDLYDELWVYGPASFYDPLQGIDLPGAVPERVFHTGFLRRDVPEVERSTLPENSSGSTILVTAGGGGDGHALMDAAIAASKVPAMRRHRFSVVLGPFMSDADKARIRDAGAGLGHVDMLEFRSDHEVLVRDADLVLGMCGYNTFCEILSFNRRALFVPRVQPRLEQAIRAERAAELGWAGLIWETEIEDAEWFAAAIDGALQAPPPLPA